MSKPIVTPPPPPAEPPTPCRRCGKARQWRGGFLWCDCQNRTSND